MDILKEKFHQKAITLSKELKSILKERGDQVVGEVKLSQILGGARGIKMMFWDGSELDAMKGIRFRGYMPYSFIMV